MTSKKTLTPRWIIVGLAAALLLLLAGGLWFYRDQERMIRHQAEERLTAIGQLKVKQIADWRAERLADAAVLAQTPAFGQAVARFLVDPPIEPSPDLLTQFGNLRTYYHYANVLLVDPAGQVRLRLTDETKPHEGYKEVLADVFRERKPDIVDLHAEVSSSTVHLSVVAPILTGTGPSAQPLGAVVLVSNASEFLYPLIAAWPMPSESAETVLVRRDGDEVLFLNQVRHRPDTALQMRIPLSQTNVPAVMAVLGQTGLFEGKDYRGVDAVSVILPVPDSPWFIVAKEDAAEVFAEWHFRAGMILILFLTLTVGLGAIGLTIWQRGKKAHYRELFRAEARLRASVERHSIVLQSVGDGVIATDDQGRVELLNPVAEALTGWSQAEAHGKPLEEIFPIINEKTRLPVDNPVTRVLREGLVVGLANHTLLIAKDGAERPISDSAAPIHEADGAVSGVVLVFRDQTEESLAHRLNQARLSLMEYASTHTMAELLTKTLDEAEGLLNSAIGFYHFVHADQKTLSLQQWSTRTVKEFCRAKGHESHYSIEQAGVWADCVREKRPIIHNDYASLPNRKGLPEGHARLVRELVVPVLKNGNVVAILGVGNKPSDYTERDRETLSYLADVTWHLVEHRKAEAVLQDSEKRYRRLFETAKDGILILDAETGAVMDVNPFLSQLLGYSHEEIRGQMLWELGVFKDIAASKEAFKTLQDRDYIRYEDLPLETRDGRHIDVEFISNSYRVDHTKVIQCNIRDISGHKQAAAERERLMAAIEQAGEAIVITDAEGVIQYVNPAFEAVTGYNRQETRGQTPRILKSGEHDQEFYCNLWSTISNGGIFQGQMVNKRKDGSLYTEEATISPVHDATGRIVNYVAVKRNITEQLRLAAQYQQAQKMESVGRLAGGVAHDFNNMLSVIIGYAELALYKVDPSCTFHNELQEILKAAKRATEVTRQLLAFARKQTIAPKVIDLNEAVEGMLKMLRRLIGEDVDLAWMPESGLWPIKVDPSQIDQIMANLCVNARDAITDVGKITIETAMASFKADDCDYRPGFASGDYVLLAVSDNGCGMDKATREMLFEPFFTTKGVGQGTGLGLATVYGIVKQNNGFINVDSEPGQGTTFRIYLPRHLGAAVDSRKADPTKITMGHGETVLIVEDETAILNLSRNMLEKLGYTVLTASTANDALRLAEEHSGQIQLLMTDVVMPEMNGRQLAELLMPTSPSLKLLFMSGYTADVIANHGVLDEGMYFLQKPFSLQDLAVKVHEVLDRE